MHANPINRNKTNATSSHFDLWQNPAVIARNHFQHKSLSDWSFNTAIGCSHGCRFCYVPSVSTIKQASRLREFGVDDPDGEWGNYVLLRPWDEVLFMASLRAAENTPRSQLSRDGNRAVMFSTTTDAYQVISHPIPAQAKILTNQSLKMVRRALELIEQESTLNVRIMTRSPLAKIDFDLFKRFKHRLLFGMSLPTLRNDLAGIYEPKAPAPSQRLATLHAAKQAGLNVYVAMAPTYPECDKDDLRATLLAVKELDPITIFHEPINIRAENINRIAENAVLHGVKLNTEVFSSRETWRQYSLESLNHVIQICRDLKISDRLHLWPDKALGSQQAMAERTDPARYKKWLHNCWSKISAWPKPAAVKALT